MKILDIIQLSKIGTKLTEDDIQIGLKIKINPNATYMNGSSFDIIISANFVGEIIGIVHSGVYNRKYAVCNFGHGIDRIWVDPNNLLFA